MYNLRRLLFNNCSRQLPVLLAYATLGLSACLFLHTLIVLPSSSFLYFDPLFSSTGQEQQLCHLPDLSPWDPSIMPYVFQVPPLACPPASEEIAIEQDQETNDLLMKSNTGNLTCRYRKVFRGEDDFSVTYSNDYHPITEFPFRKWPEDSEFLEITCIDPEQSTVRYTDIFANIRPVKKRAIINRKFRGWNVIIIGLDSVSRLNFERSLPKSLKKLQEKGAVILKGYNKIGENTFPNLTPLLTGHRVEIKAEERLVGLPHDGTTGKTFDDWPFIWYDFKRAGYATLFTEDMPSIGTFNWQKKGFAKQPTDHYGRTFELALEEAHPFEAMLNPLLQMFEYRNIHLTTSPSLCLQGRKKHNLIWDYAVKQMVRAYRDNTQPPFFSMSWLCEPSHDHVNMISICDNDLSQLIEWLTTSMDENTFVFVMSDHGARFDNIRNTLIGRIEDRMPFFSAILPAAFKATYPLLVKNFRLNAERLTTPLDFYQTLQHILRLSTSPFSQNFPRWISGSHHPNQWSASLFAEVLPETRTYWQANVPEQHCACYKETPVQEPNKDSSLQEAARFIISQINSDLRRKYHPPRVILTKGTHCAFLAYDGIESASRVGATRTVVNDARPYHHIGWLAAVPRRIGKVSVAQEDYMIIAKAKPSDALFEAHVTKKSENWMIIGEIQRINAFGNTSWCINGSAAAKKFCHCI